jgi:excisionase family DNA binding protein
MGLANSRLLTHLFRMFRVMTREGQRLAPLLTVQEVADLLRIHPKTVYDLAARGRMPCVRVGSRLRFVPRELDRWLSARKEG